MKKPARPVRQLASHRLALCMSPNLEPAECGAGAIVLSRLGLLVYGADDPKAGAIPHGHEHTGWPPAPTHKLPVLAGILQEPCQPAVTTVVSAATAICPRPVAVLSEADTPKTVPLQPEGSFSMDYVEGV